MSQLQMSNQSPASRHWGTAFMVLSSRNAMTLRYPISSQCAMFLARAAARRRCPDSPRALHPFLTSALTASSTQSCYPSLNGRECRRKNRRTNNRGKGMGELELAGPLACLAKQGCIAADDVRRLRMHIFKDGIVTRDEA